MKPIFIVICLLFQVFIVVSIKTIVIWHGIKECSEARNPQIIAQTLRDHTPKDTVIKLIQIGSNCKEDVENSIWMDTFKQVETVCHQLSNDIDLSDGFTAIGLSQGGLLFRALIQMCDKLNPFQLVSIGGPQQGVYGIPDCWSIDSKFPHFGCTFISKLQSI